DTGSNIPPARGARAHSLASDGGHRWRRQKQDSPAPRCDHENAKTSDCARAKARRGQPHNLDLPPGPVVTIPQFPPNDVAPSCSSTDSPRDFGAENKRPRGCCYRLRRCRVAHFGSAIPPPGQGLPEGRPVQLAEECGDGATKAEVAET